MAFTFPEYETFDALGLAELIGSGEISAKEVLLAAIERAEHHQPNLNFLVNQFSEQALQSIDKPLTGPLAGVPFLLKDLLVALEGQPLTSGSAMLKNYRPTGNCELVTRYQKAGLQIFGQTATPEFGLNIVTESAAYGVTKNPRHPDITAGGSSGGSAAAVAAGVVPAAHGNDGGGSIRIPASCCGLYGLKPSRGRTPVGPFILRAWQGCAIDHVLTRTVRDSAMLLDIAGGASLGEPFIAPPKHQSYLTCLQQPLRPLKIAFHTNPVPGVKVDAECKAAVENTVKQLEAQGHHVEEAEPSINYDTLKSAVYTIVAGEIASMVQYFCDSLGKTLASADIEFGSKLFAELGSRFTARQMSAAIHVFDRISFHVAEFFQTYDAYVLPTLAKPPAKHGEFAGVTPNLWQRTLLACSKKTDPLGLIIKLAEPVFQYAPFSGIFNIAGVPAASIPGHSTPEGYPVGVQVVSGFGRDDIVLQLSDALLSK